MTAFPEALAKLEILSEERKALVVSLIDDLADLEARENAEDLAAAQEALARYKKTGEAITLSAAAGVVLICVGVIVTLRGRSSAPISSKPAEAK